MKSATASIVRVFETGSRASTTSRSEETFYLTLRKLRRRADDLPAAPAIFGPLPSLAAAERLRTSAAYFGIAGETDSPDEPREGRVLGLRRRTRYLRRATDRKSRH